MIVRRKHSRQNKEIIAYVSAGMANNLKADLSRENVRHKQAMKVLTDEIGVLKEEIMEVKQINRILSLQMKKMKEDQKKNCSPVRSYVVCGKRADNQGNSSGYRCFDSCYARFTYPAAELDTVF